METKVVIIGGKGTAVDIAQYITDARKRFGQKIEVLGFAFDDPAYAQGILGLPILCGTREAWIKYKHDESVRFVFGMYNHKILKERIALRDSYGIPPERFLKFIHPSCYVSETAIVGEGCILLSNCVLNNNVKLGNYNTILSGSILEHDTEIGDNNFIAAHSCFGSGIKMGNGNFSGLHSTIRSHAIIGNYNLIGASANVIKDVGDNMILIGNPAKSFR